MFSEQIELHGHIIDSLILPKVLDQILSHGGEFKILEIRIGQQRTDPSYARVEVSGPSPDVVDDLVRRLRLHGAEVIREAEIQLATAPADGVFPDNFYVTTNQQTFVCVEGQWIEVRPAIMDSGIAVDTKSRTATALKFAEVGKGMEFVVGHHGVRVVPHQRAISKAGVFEFMASSVSIEKPKSAVIREIAADALAAHDIEHALFGTSLGVDLREGALAHEGHENHMRAINAIRGAGGIAAAVANGILRQGLMYRCVRQRIDFVLAGSIRDDGPLPEVITDALEAQRVMRSKIGGVTLALMMGTMLHSIAVGNMLPASVKTICVDINPSVVTKLADRGTFQAIGLVTDLEPFLRELTDFLAGPVKEVNAHAPAAALPA